MFYSKLYRQALFLSPAARKAKSRLKMWRSSQAGMSKVSLLPHLSIIHFRVEVIAGRRTRLPYPFSPNHKPTGRSRKAMGVVAGNLQRLLWGDYVNLYHGDQGRAGRNGRCARSGAGERFD